MRIIKLFILLGVLSLGYITRNHLIERLRSDTRPQAGRLYSGRISERSLLQLADREADIAGIPRDIFRGVVFVESGFNPNVERDELQLCLRHGWDFGECRSIGLTQIIYGFHKDFCRLKDPEELRDPETNLMCGARVLKSYIDRYGLARGVTRYNGGTRPGGYFLKVKAASVLLSKG